MRHRSTPPALPTAPSQDPTWHGEVGAIRAAAKSLGNPHLRGCVLYTSSEPCPMCMGACYWARIDKVYYATTTADVKEHGHFEDEVGEGAWVQGGGCACTGRA